SDPPISEPVACHADRPHGLASGRDAQELAVLCSLQHELYHHPISVGGDVLYRIAKVGKGAPQPGKSLFGSFHASRKAERRVAVNRIRRKQFVKYVELPGVQHLVVEPLYTALQLCAHDATAAPIALRSIATTSSERLT